MKKTNLFLISTLISILITGGFGFIATAANQAMALMVELQLEEITGDSDYILRGEVVDMKSEWNEDRTVIHTYYTISINEQIHGAHGADTITIKQRGGEVDGIGMAVSNSAVFKQGEEVVVFLKPDQAPHAAGIQQAGGQLVTKIVGREQGKYSVAKDPATSDDVIIVNRALFATTEGQLVTRPGKSIPLDEFITDIKRIKANQ